MSGRGTIVGHELPRCPGSRSMTTASIALVGDRSQSVRTHARIPLLVEALRRRDGIVLDPYWIPSEDVEDGAALDGFDGIWVVPGSPYRSPDGAVAAVRRARDRRIPFLGTCGGFQHAVLMLARDLAGIPEAAHAEYGPGGEHVVVALECSLVGHQGAIRFAPGSLMQEVMGVERSVERYHCAYGVAPAYIERLEAAGVRFGARDDQGDVRASSSRSTRSSSRRCSSPSWPATARARTRSSARSRRRARRAPAIAAPRSPPDGAAQAPASARRSAARAASLHGSAAAARRHGHSAPAAAPASGRGAVPATSRAAAARSVTSSTGRNGLSRARSPRRRCARRRPRRRSALLGG